jgi:uncharacterized protein
MNRLGDQTSPYLLQHANNPVDWHPWDDEALALAKSENKVILLSIGYSACHWCHVMAHESFESAQIARIMNENYINIKVDREERPDLDRIYQCANQLLTRQRGGWPLTMFLDPKDHLPIFGGTYFPAQANKDAPAFRDVLRGISKGYGTKEEQMKEFKSRLVDALAQTLGGAAPADIDTLLFDRACAQIESSYDGERGGFSEAPKFPHPAGLELLFDAAADPEPAKSERAVEMLDFTLTAMSRGGLFDHIGGGFYRYSVDADWTIPHFEKMLYDNGPLLALYAQRASQTGSAWFSDIANRTADWIMREMQLDDGGICSSLDADSEGEEGRFYTWSYDDVRELLGADYEAFAASYGLNEKANFEKLWHLRLAAPATDASTWSEVIDADFGAARGKLFEAREARERPARDDKVLAAWNALTIRGLALAGLHLGREDCLDAATRAVDYLRERHWQDGRLLASSRGEQVHLNAYLDDYAFLIDALLTLLSARWRDADLQFAMELADVALEHFEDKDKGGFFFTSDDHETLIQKAKPYGDDALPSGNSTVIRGLLELGFLLGEARYSDAGERGLKAGMTEAGGWPSAHATLVRAVVDHDNPPPRAILRCSAAADVSAWRQALANKSTLRARCYVIPDSATALPGLLASRTATAGADVTAYYCTGHTCSAPTTDLEAFSAELEG